MPQVTINVPSVPVVEPTTNYTEDITVNANAGATSATVSLGAITNNGNVTRDFTLTVSNVQGGSLAFLGSKDAQGNMQWQPVTTKTVTIAPNAGNEFALEFSVTPNQPGEPAVQVTATITSSWQ